MLESFLTFNEGKIKKVKNIDDGVKVIKRKNKNYIVIQTPSNGKIVSLFLVKNCELTNAFKGCVLYKTLENEDTNIYYFGEVDKVNSDSILLYSGYGESTLAPTRQVFSCNIIKGKHLDTNSPNVIKIKNGVPWNEVNNTIEKWKEDYSF